MIKESKCYQIDGLNNKRDQIEKIRFKKRTL